jgi:hypothetical protein
MIAVDKPLETDEYRTGGSSDWVGFALSLALPVHHDPVATPGSVFVDTHAGLCVWFGKTGRNACPT